MRSGWPHSIVVGLNGTAISVASDDAAVVELLERWRIVDFDESELKLVNYGLQLVPPTESRIGAEPLGTLMYGSDTLVTSKDRDSLIADLLQILGAHETAVELPQVRLGLAAVRRGEAVVLGPLESLLVVSDGWLRKHEFERVATTSVRVDTQTGLVLTDSPLGSGEPEQSFRLAGWLLPPPDNEEWTPGQAVAQAMGAAMGVTNQTSHAVLTGIAGLAAAVAPVPAAATTAGVRDQLTQLLRTD